MARSSIEVLKPHRTMSTTQFYRKLNKYSARHRKMLLDALGNPPDPKNIPESVWKQIEDENAALLILMTGAAALNTLRTESIRLQRVAGSDFDPDSMMPLLTRNSALRARQVAKWTTGTTKRRLEGLLQPPIDPDSPAPPSAAAAVKEVLGGDRMTAISANEFVAAQSVASQTVYDTAQRLGIQCTQIWVLGPCNHCEICPMLHMTPRSFWGAFSSGPPLHPNCCCRIETNYESEDSLRGQGMIRRQLANSQQVYEAVRKHGFRS